MNFLQSSNAGKKTIPKIASERILVKGGIVANHDVTFRADVFIENGVIRQLGTDLTIPGGVTTVDAKGALILPGGIDLATNFESIPWLDDEAKHEKIHSVDNFYSGSRAALIGGTTTVVDFVSGDKGRLLSTFNERSEAASKSCCDVSFHVDVTSWNDDVKQSMTLLATKHGVNSFRVHTSDRWQLNDEELFDVFLHIKSLQCIALVHAENGSLIRKMNETLKDKKTSHPDLLLTARSEDFEYEAVNRVLVIAKQVNCPLFFTHVTGKKSMERIAQARSVGQPVYCQSLVVALHRDGSSYHDPSWNNAVSCVTWPPLRDDEEAKQRQLAALTNQSVQCVSSGHCVYTNTDKALLGKHDFAKIPPGTNGVYERMMVLWRTAVKPGYIDQNQFVALTSSNAARIFNLFPRKGHIAIGSDADLVIWRDTEPQSLAESANAFHIAKPDCSNVFDGLDCDSGPVVVICHGRVVYEENQVNVIQSMGKLIERPVASSVVYNRLKARDQAYFDLIGSKHARSDSPSTTSSLNGSYSDDTKNQAYEKPERFTRNSGIRPMHQSGWSFAGDQVGDTEYKKQARYNTPPGGVSHVSLK